MISFPRIEAYNFGEITIDGIRYTNDVIVFPNRVMSDWWRESGHSLSLKDLDEVLKAHPEVLIVGTGAQARMRIPLATSRKIEELGIRLIALPTNEACEEYGQLAQEAKAIAALHLTC